MLEFKLQLERIEEGHVSATLIELDDQGGEELFIWACEVHQDLTANAQKEVVRATMNYLNKFVDLSQGGRS